MPDLPCPFRAATGVPCPLCGGTRAFEAALQGDPGFLRFNGFWVLLAAALVVLLAARAPVVHAALRTPPRALAVLGGLAAGGWAWALTAPGV